MLAIELPRVCHDMVLALIMLKHTLVPEPASQLNQTGHTINLLQTSGVFNNLEESSIGWRRLKEKGIYGILKRPDVLKTTFYI